MAMIKIHEWKRYIGCQAEFYTPRMQALLDNIDDEIQKPCKILKDDPTSTVVMIQVDNHLLVVKRSNTKDYLHFLRRLFARSRAQKNWENAIKLSKIGINTFYPIALMERKWGWLKGRSYFICSYIQGIDARSYFSQDKMRSGWKLAAKNIGHMIERLATHWISHRDLNLSNIILVDNQPWLIDLDGMRQHYCQFGARRGARREWLRFMENWLEMPVSTDVVTLFQSVFREFGSKKSI